MVGGAMIVQLGSMLVVGFGVIIAESGYDPETRGDAANNWENC
jgi:hypothetical protein